MTVDATAIFNSLQGRWRLERRISGYGAMTGEAVFRRKADDTLHYREDVEVTPDGQAAHEGFRDYIYRLRGGTIEVSFPDGRPFHRLAFDGAAASPGRASGHHDCAPDTYDAQYAFENVDAFTLHWTVKGPRKDYVSETRYSRLADPA